MTVAVRPLILLMRPESAATAPNCAMIKPQNNSLLPKIVSTRAGLPATFQATAPVRQSPPVIQPYTRLMNRAFSAAIEADPNAWLSIPRKPGDGPPND